MLILVCGFMGAGKTTFISKCSPEAIDLDEFLTHNSEVRCFETIAGFIEISGLESFRHLEFMALKDHLDRSNGDLIVGLGGGTLQNKEVRELIEEDPEIKLVWLDTPFDVCFSRIEGDSARPLANGKSKKELYQLYKSRLDHYKLADLVITDSNLEELQELQNLKQALKK